jgi:hypothetical protein
VSTAIHYWRQALTDTHTVVFIDETRTVAKDAHGREGTDYELDESPTTASEGDGEREDTDPPKPVPSVETASTTPSVKPIVPPAVPGSPTDRFLMHEDTPSRQRHDVTKSPENDYSRNYEPPSNAKSDIYLDRPVWPLQDLKEATLFNHYVQNLAHWVSNALPCAGIMPLSHREAGPLRPQPVLPDRGTRTCRVMPCAAECHLCAFSSTPEPCRHLRCNSVKQVPQ